MKVYEFKYAFLREEIKCIDAPSMALLDEILELLERRIEKVTDEMWCMWIKTARGTVTEYKKSKYYDKETKTKQDFLEKFDDTRLWFPLCAIKNQYAKYLRVGEFTICIQENRFETNNYEYDVKDYLTVVKSAIEENIVALERGTYNDMVKKELPYELRYGTINRKVFWQHYPSDKKHSLEELTEKEIQEFMTVIEKEGENYVPDNPIKGMTFNKYFDMAYECFKDLGFDIHKDKFRTFQGYGEDFGGSLFYDVNFDSEEDFDGVVDGRICGGGGHPWGLIRGSSRTRVSLYPEKTDKGYIFRLAGNPNWAAREIVKCYLTLKKIKFPAYFSCQQETLRYLKEEDLVGFVPITRTPVYCQCEFNVRVEDFRQYWESDYGKIKDLIQWQEIDEVKLKQ